MAETRIQLLAYGPDRVEERELQSAADLQALPDLPVTWLNVDGSHDAELVRQIAERFSLHPLAVEDVLTHHERAKVDTYEKYDFIVIRMLELDGKVSTEQLSMFLSERVVLTFQEEPGGDPFGPVRDRIRRKVGPLRTSGPDLLAYALLDAVVDSYFPILESYGDKLEDLEDEAVECPTTRTLSKVHEVKRDLQRIRRAVWPLREALSNLGRQETPFIRSETRIYLRDLHDQTIQVMDLIETYRDLGSGLTDLYLSSVSNRLNEIMKVLTIISTIFIPLSFIAGVYGMNFDHEKSRLNMPELHWEYGYLYSLALMALVAGMMLLYFVRKGWLGGQRK